MNIILVSLLTYKGLFITLLYYFITLNTFLTYCSLKSYNYFSFIFLNHSSAWRLIPILNLDSYFLTVNKCDKQARAEKQAPLINQKLNLQWYRFLFNGVKAIQPCHKTIWWIDGVRLGAPPVNASMFLTWPFHVTLPEKWAPWRHAVLLWDCTS